MNCVACNLHDAKAEVKVAKTRTSRNSGLPYCGECLGILSHILTEWHAMDKEEGKGDYFEEKKLGF